MADIYTIRHLRTVFLSHWCQVSLPPDLALVTRVM